MRSQRFTRTINLMVRVISSRRRFVIAAAIASLAIATNARADVVPPDALAVGEGWLKLIDAGSRDDALARYVDPPNRKVVREQLFGMRGAKIATRQLEAWVGHGEGDTSRMMPGGYFSLIFATVEATGTTRHDEVRVEPHDGQWRVVGYVRTTP
jgi:hypothetical protein